MQVGSGDVQCSVYVASYVATSMCLCCGHVLANFISAAPSSTNVTPGW